MAKENNTREFLFSGQTKVTKESHSRACLAQQWRMFLCGHTCSLTKISLILFFAVWLVPSKTEKFNHPRKFVPIRYLFSPKRCSVYTLWFYQRKLIMQVEWGRGIFGKHSKRDSKFSMMRCSKCTFVLIDIEVRLLLILLASMKAKVHLYQKYVSVFECLNYVWKVSCF